MNRDQAMVPHQDFAGGRPPIAPATSRPSSTKNSTTTASGLPLFASVVAVALLVTYLVFVALQWRNVRAADLIYARQADLLGGLEALAFAAAGAILGTTVQRQVTKKAEAEASAAHAEARDQRVRAERNEADAEKGRALHNLAKAKAAARPAQSRIRGEGAAVPASELDDFLHLAAQYDAPELQ